MRAFFNRYIGHPVLGWYVIILLLSMVVAIGLWTAGAKSHAFLASISGLAVAFAWIAYNILKDLFTRS